MNPLDTPRRRFTPRQRVLDKYPRAVAYRDKFGQFQITESRLLGTGQKERDAWADAAKRIK